MGSHRWDIADEFGEPSAGEVVDVSRKICLVQLRSTPERRSAREACLIGKPKQLQKRGEISKGRHLWIMHVVSRSGSMQFRFVHT